MRSVASPVRRLHGDAVTLIDESGYPNLVYVFNEVKKLAVSVFPGLADLKLFVGCPHAMAKHSHHQLKDTDKTGRNKRALFHTCHFPHTICVHPHVETEVTDLRHLTGLIGHEIGHIIADDLKLKNSQKQADRLSAKFLGIPIVYRGSRRLQYYKS